MPTVLNIGGLRVAIHTNDHREAHVHVLGEGHEAVFYLKCPHGPPELRENYGFTQVRLNKIAKVLLENLELLCQRWREIHGEYY